MKFTLNPQIEAKINKKGQIFQSVPSGAGDANYFELILINYLGHFTKLMDIYKEQSDIL